MKKTDTWMPLYIGDYLADTSRLTTEQHGAYLLLLMDYWRNGPPPDDESVLASICKLAPAQWKRHAPALRAFFVVDDGKWLQGRAETERAKANGVSGTRSAAGKAGAQARWSNGKDHGNEDGEPIANAIANASQNDAPSQSQSQEKEITKLALGRARPSAAPQLSLVDPPPEKLRGPPDCPHIRVLELWAKTLPAMPEHIPSQWKGARAGHLRARWREAAVENAWKSPDEGLVYFGRLFAFIGRSKFLTGNAPTAPGRTPFVVTLAWLVKPENWAKTIEGNFHPEQA